MPHLNITPHLPPKPATPLVPLAALSGKDSKGISKSEKDSNSKGEKDKEKEKEKDKDLPMKSPKKGTKKSSSSSSTNRKSMIVQHREKRCMVTISRALIYHLAFSAVGPPSIFNITCESTLEKTEITKLLDYMQQESRTNSHSKALLAYKDAVYSLRLQCMLPTTALSNSIRQMRSLW